MKISDIKAGDRVKITESDHCLPYGEYTVRITTLKKLYIVCLEGEHFLESHEDENGELVGISKV